MLGHGKNKNGILVIMLFLIAVLHDYCLSQYYYVCSYEEPDWGTEVLFSKIDLQSKTLVYSVSVPLEGQIQSRIPIEFQRGNSKFFFISAFDGLSGKNSRLMLEGVSNYAILDEDGNIVYSAQIPNIQLLEFKYVPGEGAGIKFLNNLGGQMKGILTLNNQNRINVSQVEEDPYNDAHFPEISGFRYFNRIKTANELLYWNTTLNGRYLLSIDVANNRLIDSLSLDLDTEYSNLFGLSDDDSLVYVFYMNHNYLGQPAEMRKLEVDRSFVKVLRSGDFSLVDSIAIDYPPIDSGYVGRETGSIEKIGSYFIYFFLEGEDYRYFSPAMLFIFDTRTNEATWLRVGWR